MSEFALRVEGLGKRYRLGALDSYRMLRDSVANLWRREANVDERTREIWALRDVSFDLQEGEVLGIIGRNGAGKTTLLKLISSVTRPDTGRIELNGGVGALLEVGTGFHPELTGRENIYMNATILGMSRREVAKKFDAIVAFSGVEEFLDTPVKRYSSGMRVRLGFAVAAHVEPAILVVDEVLAVGDAEFQRRCLGRMHDVATEGRTVLFVSHQMEAIQSLCTRAIWLQSGMMTMDGEANDVVAAYLSATLKEDGSAGLEARTDRTGEGEFQVTAVTVGAGEMRSAMTGGPVTFRVESICRRARRPSEVQVMVRLAIRDHMDRVLALLSNELTGEDLPMPGEIAAFACTIDRLPLVPGRYMIDVALWVNGLLQDKMFRASSFDVLPGDFYGGGRATHVGSFHIAQRWASVP